MTAFFVSADRRDLYLKSTSPRPLPKHELHHAGFGNMFPEVSRGYCD
jgi:hypothetical protein